MCNQARFSGEPETLFERFGASWAQDVVRPNKDPQELYPDEKTFVAREETIAASLMSYCGTYWAVLPNGR